MTHDCINSNRFTISQFGDCYRKPTYTYHQITLAMQSESNNTTDWDERALRRAIVKCNELVEHMKILYDIASTLQTDKSVVPIFLARSRKVVNYVIDLNLETDIILDQLIVLNRDSEYEIQHIPIKRKFMEQYYFIIAIISTLSLDDRGNTHPEPSSSHCQLPKKGFLLFYVASRVLDSTTKRLFESAHHDVRTPTIDLLL